MQSLLGSAGYDLITAGSGQEALSLLAGAPVFPDLLLLDNMMPDMSGLDVCRRLRELYPAQRLPIIMVSARVEEEAVVSGLDVGADDYITKPFKRNEFLARVRGKLEMAQQDSPRTAAAPTTPGADAGVSLLSSSSTAALAAAAAAAAASLPPAPRALERSISADLYAAGPGSGVVMSSCGLPPVVLCVDDDEVNQLVLQGMLHSQDYGYLKARTGSEGLACFPGLGGDTGSSFPGASRPPDLVLVDSSLPDMKGLSFVRRLRETYTKLQLPIIILTAR
ncbi:hypothetical protein MNEG_14087 [Monoraphidium neglectum]|uniref:Response regulatory domain-containing protein n=1 Tax=Monoraphidium neglectum TaxID=145388 RepID=A0A0D2MFJ4_9CHLO|nr:hypothetical protein MNEG_14087 [Monoraphidium neglectum]KIY93875.1 hypothetical protein MNEG_14087 [Monoraphidium neglectum]|eukprot:XP_013892895.1 hypothetical protein MNEG_14087 [Monoraphidium neglectum]